MMRASHGPAVLGQQDQGARQPFLARIEMLANQTFSHLNKLRQSDDDEKLGDGRIFADGVNDAGTFQPRHTAIGNACRGRHANPVTNETTFAGKAAGVENAKNAFLALARHHRDLDLPVLKVVHGVGGLALAVEQGASTETGNGYSAIAARESLNIKRLAGIECCAGDGCVLADSRMHDRAPS